MKLTPEELKQLPKGIYVMNKCDHCGRLLSGFLTYRGINNQKEYCSNACFEAGEHPPPGFHQKLRSETMITKKLENKAAAPKAEEPKKTKKAEEPKKAPKPAPEPEEPKKGKKAEEPKKVKKAEPAPEPEEPKKGKKAEEPKKAPKPAPKAEEPKKGKKAEEPKKTPKAAKKTPYREGSSFAVAFERLMTGKPLTLDQMFDGLSAGDPSRMASHMLRRGDESKEFTIERLEDGRLQMTKVYGK